MVGLNGEMDLLSVCKNEKNPKIKFMNNVTDVEVLYCSNLLRLFRVCSETNRPWYLFHENSMFQRRSQVEKHYEFSTSY